MHKCISLAYQEQFPEIQFDLSVNSVQIFLADVKNVGCLLRETTNKYPLHSCQFC